MRSGNPALTENTFGGFKPTSPNEAMTIQGAASKTLFLLLVMLIPAVLVWHQFFSSWGDGAPKGMSLYLWGGAIGGLVFAMITIFKKEWSPVTSNLYAICEGFFIGAISATYEAKFPGIVVQAVSLTMATLFSLLLVYKMGLIRATDNFKLGVVAATGGIGVVYLLTLGLSFFGISIPYIHDSGWIGIGFSLFVVVIAALNLVLDFDFIEDGAAKRAPKYMEWYAAFGLLVTLIWLYLEILRLLGKLSSRK